MALPGDIREIVREELKPPNWFRSHFISKRGIREVHSLIWYKDRLLAGVGPVDGGLYDVLTGELIAKLPYDWTDMWAKFYHQDRDIVLIGPFVYDGEKVKTIKAIPGPNWEVYWYALDLEEPEKYVLAGTFAAGIYRINLDTLEVTKYVDYPFGWPNGSRSGVTKHDGHIDRDRLVVCFSKKAGLYAYDPVDGWLELTTHDGVKTSDLGIAWMTVATPTRGSGWPIIALGHSAKGYAICYPEDAHRIYKLNLLPKEIYFFDRSEVNNWLLYLNYSLEYLGNIGDMLFAIGDMYRGDGNIVYLGTFPHHVFSAEVIGNIIALGSGAKGALGSLNNPYWGTDVGTVTLMTLEELVSKLSKLPAVAIPWDSESISAGETSLPVVTAGWTRKTLLFEADADGTLTIEVDVDGSGNWKTYDTVSIVANTPKWYIFTGDFTRVRLSFDTTATVTAKLYLHP